MISPRQIAACIEAEDITTKDHRIRYKAFFDLCKKDLGITDHPKADKLMDIAWSEGHSAGYYGYYDVYYFAEELVELIKP